MLGPAGSGKTRVLAHRIAMLVARGDVPPRRILGFARTEREAALLRARAERLLAAPLPGAWIDTLAGACRSSSRSPRSRAASPRGRSAASTTSTNKRSPRPTPSTPRISCGALAGKYRRRFSHVVIDYFEDTSASQRELIAKLVGDDGDILAAADEQQADRRRR